MELFGNFTCISYKLKTLYSVDRRKKLLSFEICTYTHPNSKLWKERGGEVKGTEATWSSLTADAACEDGLRSEEVAEWKLDVLLTRRRLRWFFHVQRRGQEELLGTILELEFTGRCPRGRPKKRWRKILESDMILVGTSKIGVLERANSKGKSAVRNYRYGRRRR